MISVGKHYIDPVGQPTESLSASFFNKIVRLVGQLGSGPRLVGHLGSEPRLMGRIGSGVRVSASF